MIPFKQIRINFHTLHTYPPHCRQRPGGGGCPGWKLGCRIIFPQESVMAGWVPNHYLTRKCAHLEPQRIQIPIKHSAKCYTERNPSVKWVQAQFILLDIDFHTMVLWDKHIFVLDLLFILLSVSPGPWVMMITMLLGMSSLCLERCWQRLGRAGGTVPAWRLYSGEPSKRNGRRVSCKSLNFPWADTLVTR